MGLALVLTSTQAQDKKSITADLDIRTSSVCDMCEKTIESGLIYEKGVKKVDLDLATSTIHVTYDPKRTDAEKLRHAVEAGFRGALGGAGCGLRDVREGPQHEHSDLRRDL